MLRKAARVLRQVEIQGTDIGRKRLRLLCERLVELLWQRLADALLKLLLQRPYRQIDIDSGWIIARMPYDSSLAARRVNRRDESDQQQQRNQKHTSPLDDLSLFHFLTLTIFSVCLNAGLTRSGYLRGAGPRFITTISVLFPQTI